MVIVQDRRLAAGDDPVEFGVATHGTTTRLASDAQYYAMVARDGGGRWPGCDRPPGWCQAHHFDEVFRDDGPTDLANMGLVCSTHHDYVHHKDRTFVGDADDLHIRQPNGTLIPSPARGPIFNTPRQLQLATS